MRIAFHTPLNRYRDAGISGDRRMARQLVAALRGLGHEVAPVEAERDFLSSSDPDLLARHRAAADRTRETLLARWEAGEPAPELWFTYHNYYRAPDLLGPEIAERLSIPYVVAEGSDAFKRARGEWAAQTAIVRHGLALADLHLYFTERDRLGLEYCRSAHSSLIELPPFIAFDQPPPARAPQSGATRLVTIAMMREGTKLKSYLTLARVLQRLPEKDWTLTVIGDGHRRGEIEQAFSAFPAGRIRWLGAIQREAALAELASHDLFIWPGIGEAYGLVYLEAQAIGLPVVAFSSGGVPATVSAGETALLAPEGDEAGLAGILAELIDDPARRESMGAAARRFALTQRTPARAAEILSRGLADASRNLACRAAARGGARAGETPWSRLEQELDNWTREGRRLRLWLRDDDAVAPSAALDRLARLGERFGVPFLLAVIPMLAEPSLAGALASQPWLLPCQHGVRHHNHAPGDAKKSEFGAERPEEAVAGEIAQARARLQDLLDGAALPVFVPPWNRIAPVHARRLAEIGFAGLSCFRNDRPVDDGRLVVGNTHLDIMDWRGGRVGRPVQNLLSELHDLLARRRRSPATDEEALGILLHHRDHDEVAWNALDTLLAGMSSHPTVALADPRAIFGLPPTTPSAARYPENTIGRLSS